MVFLSAISRFTLAGTSKFPAMSKSIIKKVKLSASQLNGYFALFKEKNQSMEEVINNISLTLQDELGTRIQNLSGKKLFPGSHLNPIGSGVIVFYIGSKPKLATSILIDFSNKRYRALIKLGTETETSCSLGKVLEEKSFDHVTKNMVEESLVHFVGTKTQINPPYHIFNKYERFSDINPQELRMKVPHVKRDVYLEKGDCLSFQPPYVELDLHVTGRYSVERLASDMGRYLNTCAHLVELERTEYFVFNLSNALPTYKWYKMCIEEEIQLNKMKVQEALRKIIISADFQAKIEKESRG